MRGERKRGVICPPLKEFQAFVFHLKVSYLLFIFHMEWGKSVEGECNMSSFERFLNLFVSFRCELPFVYISHGGKKRRGVQHVHLLKIIQFVYK